MLYRIGTRGSALALKQAELVRTKLKSAFPEDNFDIIIIQTSGDKNLKTPLHQFGHKGIFIKEIEEALLEGRVDLGVHSMKDMPEEITDGFTFAKVWPREDARDALVLREKNSLAELPAGAVIATGSKRRQCQLLKLRPDLEAVNIRGNIDTRLRKMHEQKLDGVILAAAALKRLGLEELITEYFPVDRMVPAAAQGAIAIELVESRTDLLNKINSFGDVYSDLAVKAERAFLKRMGGGCHSPIGAYCEISAADPDSSCASNRGSNKDEYLYNLKAAYGTEDLQQLYKVEVSDNSLDKLIEKAYTEISQNFRL